MSSGKGWSGEQEFTNALNDLNNAHPVPTSKVKVAVNVAMKYSNDFKMIVYDLEKWMKKSIISDRIAGIFVMDSICRGSRAQHRDKSKDLFSLRFLTRLTEILGLMNGASDHDIKSLLRVVDEWLKSDIFPLDRIQLALRGIKSPAMRIPTENMQAEVEQDRGPTISSTEYDPRQAFNRGPGSPPGKESSSSAVVSKDNNNIADVLGKRKGIKYCPYRDGNCPYGDRCRYSHADGKIYYPSVVKKHRRHSMLGYISANHILNDALAQQILSPDLLVKYYMQSSQQVVHNPIFHVIDDSLQRVSLPVQRIILEYDEKPVDPQATSLAITAVGEEQYKTL